MIILVLEDDDLCGTEVGAVVPKTVPQVVQNFAVSGLSFPHLVQYAKVIKFILF
jgi:hypothetical protein